MSQPETQTGSVLLAELVSAPPPGPGQIPIPQSAPPAAPPARTEALFQAAVAAEGGTPIAAGEGPWRALFPTPTAAVRAAAAAQVAFQAAGAPVRQAIHQFPPVEGSGEGAAAALGHAAAVLAAGHSGQVLLSQAAAAVLEPPLPPPLALHDLGEVRLPDLVGRDHLYQLLGAGAPWALPAEFPPLRTLDRRPNNLASRLYPLVNMAPELADAVARLRDSPTRVVILAGAAGTGKTRLAAQVAAALLGDFADGVWFVALGMVRDPDQVPAAIATTLGIKERSGTPVAGGLAEYLRPRHLLLVLDNFEQVAAAIPALTALLEASPGLRVLFTSRTALSVAGAAVIEVAPLAVPDLHRLPPLDALLRYPAIALFVARAEEVAPGFTLTAENAPAVAALCARLDGLPLAIELAAARIRQMDPAAMLARLEGGAAPSSLALLAGGAPHLVARHQTLRAAIGWSYTLLEPGEQIVFSHLAVFAGGCTAPAPAVVVAEGDLEDAPPPLLLAMLDSLIGKHLLRARPGADDTPRFGMLSTIREYALDELEASGEAPALRRRHAAYYTALAEQAEAAMRGPQQALWQARLADDHDNIRAALGWLLARGDAAGAQRLSGALWRFWDRQGHLSEGRRWLESALAAGPTVPGPIRHKALNGAGALAWSQGDYRAATAYHEENLALRRRLGDPKLVGASLNNLGITAMERGDYARARLLLEEGLAIDRALGDEVGQGIVLNNLGRCARYQGDFAAAHAHHEESLAIRQARGDSSGQGYSYCNLGELAQFQGHHAEAIGFYRQSLHWLHEAGDYSILPLVLEGIGRCRGRMGDPTTAARLLGGAAAIRATTGSPLYFAEQAGYDADVAAIRAQTDAATWDTAWASGQALTSDEILAEVLTPLPAG